MTERLRTREELRDGAHQQRVEIEHELASTDLAHADDAFLDDRISLLAVFLEIESRLTPVDNQRNQRKDVR